MSLREYVKQHVTVTDDGKEEPYFSVDVEGWDNFHPEDTGDFLTASDIVFPMREYEGEEEVREDLREEDDAFISLVKIRDDNGWHWLAGGSYII